MTSLDQTSMAPRQKSKIQSLEGLRGLMAWWVVFGHISLSFNFGIPIIDRNTLPVDVFIVLSGFVIARLIDRKNESYLPYIVRRGFRIIPLYLAVLFVSCILLRIQSQAWMQLPFHSPSNANRIALAMLALDQTAPHLFAHITLLHGLVPETVLPSAAFTLLGQAWSISLEWQFYLLAPTIMWGLRRRRRWVGLGVALIILILLGRYFSNGFLGNRIPHFMIGITSYLTFDRPVQRKYWISVAIVFSVVALVRSGPWQVLPLTLWAAVLASSSAPSHSTAHMFARVLSAKPFTHLGEISYSIYLVHMIPLYCSIYFINRYYLSLSPSLIAVFVAAATILCTYIMALLSFNLVEKPCIKLGVHSRHLVDRVDDESVWI